MRLPKQAKPVDRSGVRAAPRQEPSLRSAGIVPASGGIPIWGNWCCRGRRSPANGRVSAWPRSERPRRDRSATEREREPASRCPTRRARAASPCSRPTARVGRHRRATRRAPRRPACAPRRRAPPWEPRTIRSAAHPPSRDCDRDGTGCKRSDAQSRRWLRRSDCRSRVSGSPSTTRKC